MKRQTKIPDCVFISRFALSYSVLAIYVLLSTLSRISFLIWSWTNVSWQGFSIIKSFVLGFAYDIAVGLCFLFLYNLYLLIVPKKLIGSAFDRVFTYAYFALNLFIIYFSLIAEFPFWDEFGVRFNFIAVDYLIYTYEVVSNINQSYPIPLIIAVLLGLIALTFWLLKKSRAFTYAFHSQINFGKRLLNALPLMLLCIVLISLLTNKQSDYNNNTVINEVGKNGVFSFFAAFRSNELDYDKFYPQINEREAYAVVRQQLLQNNQSFASAKPEDLSRITSGGVENRPNIILVTIESFSGSFLKAFGNTDDISPNYDSLANKSIFFTNLYATGTRTVRGMEALTLCVPPTPGNSIVRRPNNEHIFSIATIMRHKGYQPYFIYGGDGYFDNMNTFFGGQGFDIVDRDRGNPLSDEVSTRRYQIADDEVSFENAWGICDEDLYTQSLKYADRSFATGKPFFQFVMTTSNHRPFTFPNGKINLPQGDRNGAVKYTDYALGKFITEARAKPWFKNTVFVVVADHCASSAGKWEINIDKHHIPAIIFNLPVAPIKVKRLMSQIDLMPTLFGYLHWNYTSAFYGKDINQTQASKDRAFIGNYRTLGLLKQNVFTQINDRKQVKQFNVSEQNQQLKELKTLNQALAKETIASYQTASERFKNGQMKEKRTNN